MTRNRPTADEAASVGGTRLGRAVGAVLTVTLLAPAAAVLTSRLRGLIDLEAGLGSQCGGIDALGPALRTSLPVVLLVLAIPVALLSLGHRARGWVWLFAALVGVSARLEVQGLGVGRVGGMLVRGVVPGAALRHRGGAGWFGSSMIAWRSW